MDQIDGFKVNEEYIDQLAKRVARLDTFIEQNNDVNAYELLTSIDSF